MSKLGINQLCEGMIVDEAVSDLRGTILLQKGTAITLSGIKILKTWGVFEISVEEASAAEHNVSTETQLDARTAAEAAAKAARLFQHVDQSDRCAKELMRLTICRIAQSRPERS